MIITGSPNKDGLTAACAEQARLGVAAASAETVMVRLNDLAVGMCRACSSGWGTCRDQHFCQVEDDFQALHAALEDTAGFILITPVYWSDMSESVKAFIDRLRRCEAMKQENQYLSGKPLICVAAAGGSGTVAIHV